jgi:hypothetical protein
VAEGRDATVVFKGVPLFHTPWLSFSLNNKRKSGLLAPTFGTSSKSGIEFTLPYYWDIAPNMDATISPRLMSKRGLQLNTEYRYLNHDYRGLARVEWLPNDRLADRNRYGYSILHSHNNLGYGFSGYINVSGVSAAPISAISVPGSRRLRKAICCARASVLRRRLVDGDRQRRPIRRCRTPTCRQPSSPISECRNDLNASRPSSSAARPSR